MSSVYQRAIVGGNWADYTPTLGGFAIGNGTIASRFFRTGKLVFVDDRIVFGTTSTFGGSVTLTLPTSPVSGSTGLLWIDGTAQLSTSSGQYLTRWRWSGSVTQALTPVADEAYARLTAVTSTVPLTFVNASVLTRHGFYEEA